MQRIERPNVPARVLHLLFAAGVVAAAVVAIALGKAHRGFPLHSTIGLGLAVLVIVRLAWAMAPRHPGEVPPAGRAAPRIIAAAMYALVLGLAGTGLLMTKGGADPGPAHALLAYVLVGTALVHTAWAVMRARGAAARATPGEPGVVKS